MFANGPGDLGSIPGRVIPKTQKMVLDASLLNTQHYKVRIKGKVEQSREGVAPSPTNWCSSYRKGSLRVTLDYGRQLYFTYIYIYIYVCVCVCVILQITIGAQLRNMHILICLIKCIYLFSTFFMNFNMCLHMCVRECLCVCSGNCPSLYNHSFNLEMALKALCF